MTAKVYGLALFKQAFVKYCGGKPNKFATAVSTKLTLLQERDRVAKAEAEAKAKAKAEARGGILGRFM